MKRLWTGFRTRAGRPPPTMPSSADRNVSMVIDPLRTDVLMLALGHPGVGTLQDIPFVHVFAWAVQPGVVLAVAMYLLATHAIHGSIQAWDGLWRWLLWSGLGSQAGIALCILSRVGRTEYSAPGDMELVSSGQIAHNCIASRLCASVTGSPLAEANGVFVREGAVRGAARFVKRGAASVRSFEIARRAVPNSTCGEDSVCWCLSEVEREGGSPKPQFVALLGAPAWDVSVPPVCGWYRVSTSGGAQGHSAIPELTITIDPRRHRVTLGVFAALVDLFCVGAVVFGLPVAASVASTDWLVSALAAGAAPAWASPAGEPRFGPYIGVALCTALTLRGITFALKYWGLLDRLWERKRCTHGLRRMECEICTRRRARQFGMLRPNCARHGRF